MFSVLLTTLLSIGGSDAQDKTTIKKPADAGKLVAPASAKPADKGLPAPVGEQRVRRFQFRSGDSVSGNVNGVRSRSGVFNRRVSTTSDSVRGRFKSTGKRLRGHSRLRERQRG